MKKISRAAALVGSLLVAAPAFAGTMTMLRDPNCGCCIAWAKHVRSTLGEEVIVRETTDIAAAKARLGVPDRLASCHTAVIDGYVIEGHVPAGDIARLLKTRPKGVKGLAVPGMPLGSPGMESAGPRQSYQVIAFGPKGSNVFARY